MEQTSYLETITREGARLAEVATGRLETDIGFLGDWTIRDLVAHLGGVYAFATANVLAQSDERRSTGPEAVAPPGDAVVDWFGERLSAVAAALQSSDPTATAWTFAGVKTVAFWIRRMAHETSIHRWDAEAATGLITPLDAEIATDGIDEYSEVGLRFSSSKPNRVYPSQTLHLHRTDGPGEWMFTAGEDGAPIVTHEHGKGDAAVRGTAGELLLWVWGRPVTDVEMFGDPLVARAWQDVAP